MLYTPPRSTFHHTVLSGLVGPIGSVVIHVDTFLSTALPALNKSCNHASVDWVAFFLKDKSSVKKKMHYILNRVLCIPLDLLKQVCFPKSESNVHVCNEGETILLVSHGDKLLRQDNVIRTIVDIYLSLGFGIFF